MRECSFKNACKPCRPGGIAGNDEAAAGRGFGNVDDQPSGGHQRAQPIRPFDQADGVSEGILDPEFIGFFRVFEPVQIEMPDLERAARIGLDQGEGGTRDIFGITRQGIDQGACEGRLAGAESPCEGNHVTRRQNGRDPGGEVTGPILVGNGNVSNTVCLIVHDCVCICRFAGEQDLNRRRQAPILVLPRPDPPGRSDKGPDDVTIEPAHERFSTDVAIIGAGPVGLFAVFQCGMLGMKCRLIDALDDIGGQCAALYPEKPIFDIPAQPEISAGDLIRALDKQMAPFEPHIHLNQQVTGLSGKAGDFRLTTSAGTEISARAVIIAAGVGAFGPKRPPLAGIERYEAQGPGLGVKYMVGAVKDFAGKRVVIAGGGDSAVDWAIQLSGIADKVHVVHRRARFRAMEESVRRMTVLAEDGSIDLVTPYQLQGLDGTDDHLEAVIVADLDGNERRIDADVLLAFYGLSQNLGPILDWGLGAGQGGIPADPATAETSVPGIYAIGDVSDYPGKLKLILTGFSEAAFAAHHAYTRVFPDKALHFEYSTTKGVPSAK